MSRADIVDPLAGPFRGPRDQYPLTLQPVSTPRVGLGKPTPPDPRAAAQPLSDVVVRKPTNPELWVTTDGVVISLRAGVVRRDLTRPATLDTPDGTPSVSKVPASSSEP